MRSVSGTARGFGSPARTQILTLAPIGSKTIRPQNEKMKLRILWTIFIILVIVVVGGLWIVKQAFGPSERTVEIAVTDTQTLVCKEIYNADFAAMFFDVDFKLINNDNDKTINLGQATFSDDQWDKKIKLDSVSNCYVLSFYEDSYLRLLIGNKITSLNVDTTLVPLNLKRDKTWRQDNRDIKLRRMYSVSSKLEEIRPTFFKVNFEYKTEDSLSYRQCVIYKVDSITGRLLTKEFFNKEEIRK
jgi:hypothetical protein